MIDCSTAHCYFPCRTIALCCLRKHVVHFIVNQCAVYCTVEYDNKIIIIMTIINTYVHVFLLITNKYFILSAASAFAHLYRRTEQQTFVKDFTAN